METWKYAIIRNFIILSLCPFSKLSHPSWLRASYATGFKPCNYCLPVLSLVHVCCFSNIFTYSFSIWCLLMMPISDFARLSNLHVGLNWKFFQWSLIVTKASRWLNFSKCSTNQFDWSNNTMGIEKKWWELHNRLVNCNGSTSIHLRNEKMWFMFVWNVLITRAN